MKTVGMLVAGKAAQKKASRPKTKKTTAKKPAPAAEEGTPAPAAEEGKD